MHRLVTGAAVVALLVAAVASVEGKETILSGGSSGDRQCPCFCSERDNDDHAPYWNAYFGFDYVDGTACATPCRNASDTAMLANCAEHVNYRWCVRRMNNTMTTTATLGPVADELAAFLDGHVRGCTSDLTWDDQDSDCMRTVRRAACYFAFPKCSPVDDAALDVCRSVCENERITCRELNSNWGSLETMACGAYEDAVGPSDLCTGGSGTVRPRALVVAIVAAVVAIVAAAVRV